MHQETYQSILKSLEEAPEQLMANRLTNKFVELYVMQDSIEVLCLSEDEQLICRSSRFLSPAEINYSLIEKQLLALVLAVKRFKIWLNPGNFIVRVPCKGLKERCCLSTNRRE